MGIGTGCGYAAGDGHGIYERRESVANRRRGENSRMDKDDYKVIHRVADDLTWEINLRIGKYVIECINCGAYESSSLSKVDIEKFANRHKHRIKVKN